MTQLPPPYRELIHPGSGRITEQVRTNVHCIDLHTFWSTWSESSCGYTIRTWIELARLTADGWQIYVEGGNLTRTDCPVEYFDFVSVGDRDWRDACYRYAEEELTKQYAKGA